MVDAYNAGGPKSQGIFASTADGMLIEFNVIDHNGWKTGFQVPDDRSHNMYLDDMTNLTIRNNIISNASSEGILVRSENGANLTNHVLIENNLLAANGNSMSVGAKTGEGASVQYGAIDATIRNNVLTETGRVLGGADQSYGIDLGSINGGLITNNLLLNKPNNGTSFGIRLESIVASQNVTISNNVLYNWNQGFVGLSAGPLTNIQVIGNKFQDKLYQSPSVSSEGVLSTARATFSNNTYYTNAAASNWFMIQDAPKSFTNWLTLSKETGAVSQAVTFPDVSRTVESYSASIGGSATLSSLIGAERLQSQATWRPELEARNIVNYLGAGFGISPL